MNIDFKNKQTIGLLGAAGVLLLVVIGAVVVLLMTPAKAVPVEDFSVKTVAEIQQWASENKIPEDQLVVQYEFSDTVDKDKVISQSIPKEGKLGKEDILTIVVSKGPDPDVTVTLPDFKDMTQEEIEKFAEENKLLDVTFEYAVDEKIPEGKFIKLNIADTEIKRSTMLIFTISKGENAEGEDIVMPDFMDYTKAKITNWAKTNKITVTWKEAYSDDIAKDKVISQDPKAGETVKTGSKVTVTMSLGKPVEMKSLAKMSKEDALKWLKDNNLKSELSEAYSGSIDYGAVISNSPDSGKVAQGSTIKVKISLGKIKMESFIGKKKADAEAFKNKANGLEGKLEFSFGEVESTEPVGTIVSQNVSSGTYMAPGTKVYFEISKGKSVTVDSKSGVSEDEFKNYITGLGLKLGSRSTAYHDSIAAGSIISNDSGSKASGASVNYVVSEGLYTPPTFTGTFAEAQNAINAANGKGAGWSIQKAGEEYNESTAAGYLISNKQSVSGKTVYVTVSLGPAPKPVSVGSYAGKSFTEFNSFISNNGLKLGTKSEEYSEDYAAGVIISNSTGEFPKGTSIDYKVSLGSRYTYINDLNGYIVAGDPEGTKNKILSYLTGQGIPSGNINISIVTSDVSKGEIVDCPPAGQVDKTATITIVISSGPAD